MMMLGGILGWGGRRGDLEMLNGRERGSGRTGFWFLGGGELAI